MGVRRGDKYGIYLVPLEPRPERIKYTHTMEWKIRLHRKMQIRFFFQTKRAFQRMKRSGTRVRASRGYGVPEWGESMCPRSRMVTFNATPEEIRLSRRYWLNCFEKSKEIYWWLVALPPARYTWWLNLYLNRLIVTTEIADEELERYERAERVFNGPPDPERPLYFQQDAKPSEAEAVQRCVEGDSLLAAL